jgi:uncharacterized protein
VAGVDSDDKAAGDKAAGDLEARLQAALRDALKTRDVLAAFAVRSALGAIGNASAVPADPPGVPAAAPGGSAYVAKAAAGAGAAEVTRRALSPAEVRQIVEAEVSERETAASQYERTGHADRAGSLRREAQVLRGVLDG